MNKEMPIGVSVLKTVATKNHKSRVKESLPLLIMLLPGFIYLFINNYLPLTGLVIAFKTTDFSKGFLGGAWIGFKNFEYLFKTSDALIITRNTVLYNLVFITLGIVVQIALAIFINEVRRKFFARLYQSAIILPAVISMVIVSYLVFALLSSDTGLINKAILPALGLQPISWYNTPKYWPFILVFVNIWKNTGFACIIYLATIVGISNDYYEAALIDGASKWKQIRYITLPLLKPTVIMLTILNIGKIFYSDFGLFFQVPLDSGTLYSVTNTIDTYVYRGLMEMGDIGMSAAAGLYQSLVGFLLVMVTNFIVSKVNDGEGALF